MCCARCPYTIVCYQGRILSAEWCPRCHVHTIYLPAHEKLNRLMDTTVLMHDEKKTRCTLRKPPAHMLLTYQRIGDQPHRGLTHIPEVYLDYPNTGPPLSETDTVLLKLCSMCRDQEKTHDVFKMVTENRSFQRFFAKHPRTIDS